jgi:hypothetical protein
MPKTRVRVIRRHRTAFRKWCETGPIALVMLVYLLLWSVWGALAGALVYFLKHL